MLFVTWYIPSDFLEQPKNYLTLLYRPPRTSQNTRQIKIGALSAHDMPASNYRFMVTKKSSIDIDLKATCKWNLRNFIVVVVAKCYSQNLNISMGFGGANSLISRLFCPPRAKVPRLGGYLANDYACLMHAAKTLYCMYWRIDVLILKLDSCGRAFIRPLACEPVWAYLMSLSNKLLGPGAHCLTAQLI